MTPPLLRLALALFEESQQLAAASGGNRPEDERAIGCEQVGEIREAAVIDVVAIARQRAANGELLAGRCVANRFIDSHRDRSSRTRMEGQSSLRCRISARSTAGDRRGPPPPS